MICPNCKHEVMNVNGRYVCVECGTELQEGQLQYSADTATDQELPAEVPVTSEVQNHPIVEEILAEPAFSAPVDVPAAPAAAETTLEAPAEEAVPMAIPEPSPVSEEVAPTELPAVEPMTDAAVLEEAENTSETVATSSVDDVVEPLAAADVVAETTEPEVSLVPESPVDVPIVPEALVASFAEQPIVPSFDTISQPDTIQPAMESVADLSSQPVATMDTPMESFSETADQPQEVSPEIPTPTFETPVEMNMAPTESIPSIPEQIEPMPAQEYQAMETPSFAAVSEPEVGQAPTFSSVENQGPTGYEDKTQEELANEQIASDNKKLYIILAVGAVVFIAFLVGGILAYSRLTAPAVINQSSEEPALDAN